MTPASLGLQRPLPPQGQMLHRRSLGRRRGKHSRHQSRRRQRHWPCAEARRRRDATRDRGGSARAEDLGAKDRKGARCDLAQMVQPDDGEPGRPGADHDRRAGQAAGGVARRDRLRRLVHRVLRRRRQAHLWRNDPLALDGLAHGGDQAAGRRHRGDHAVELPQRDDHPQGGPGARGRMRFRLQAGRGNAAVGARDCGARSSAPEFPRAYFRSSPARRARSAPR